MRSIRKRSAALSLSGLLLSLGGCESLVDSNLDTHGKSEVAFSMATHHQAFKIASGDRRLAASYVTARAPRGLLLLIFHGDGEAIGDWSKAQAFLADQGYDSFVFDYSGYGASTGHPSIDHLREDAQAAYALASKLAQRRSVGVFIVAHSLGCNVAIDAAGTFSPKPLGYALWGVMPSLRDFVARSGVLPRPLLFLIPDRWNNLRNAGDLGVPTLVLHGDDDHVMTEQGARAVAASAKPPAAFQPVPHAEHNALYKSPDLHVWKPILDMASLPG